MNNNNKFSFLFKLLFIILFLTSLAFNFALNNNLTKQKVVIDNLYKYKKAYIGMTQALGINPEQSEAFLERIEKD
jgi:hypothetical protein|tara:strand:+ start:530 stop:754 length:225 start_codon:yes stop_codon:yes gene_type:complete